MRHTLWTIVLSCIVLCSYAEDYTIVFNSSETGSDGTAASTDINKLVNWSSFDFAQTVDASQTNNIYVGKNGYGIKGSNASTGGKLTLVLDTTYTVRTITLWAAAGNKADTTKTFTKGISVCGQTILWKAPCLELQPYTITLNRAINTIDIQALVNKNNRFYVEHIELDIVDTYSSRGKIQLSPKVFKFPSMEYDSIVPAEDMENFEVQAQAMQPAGLTLHMKTGTTFSVSPTTLPAEGGEFTISYSTHVQPSFYNITDTCIISGVGQNGTVITKRMAVSTMVYAPKPYVVDSSDMVVSVAPAATYYLPAESKCDSALKSELGLIICRGHRYKYGSGNHKSWAGFFYTDRDPETNMVLDMYSNNERYFNPERPTASVSGFDIEHMFPKSWWGGGDDVKAYHDLFHLVPGDYSANRSKSNHAPGIPTDTSFNNGSFITGADAVHGLTRVFCPADEYKGDFARAYFYIACAYGNSLRWVERAGSDPAAAMTNNSWEEFRPWLRDLLLSWHRMDPVSEKETTRAIEVNKIQGNRNPFIDYPELVELIWGNRKGEQAHFASMQSSFEHQPTTDNSEPAVSRHATKVMHNGHLLIIIDDRIYDELGRISVVR